MSYEGRLLWTEGEESETELRSVNLSDRKLICEWFEDGEIGYLEASSEDGFTYRGAYGYPRLEGTRLAQLKRYDSEHETVFVGTWRNLATTREGFWIFFVARKQ